MKVFQPETNEIPPFKVNLTRMYNGLFLLINLLSYALCTNAQRFDDLKFKEETKAFPTSEKDLRKWDAPIVADLDQDGNPDILLNDHGFSVQVMWNDNGRFGKPIDIIMGDMHGIAVGNIDADENLELILSRGGGSGSNAHNSKLYKVTKKREFLPQGNFDVPLKLMRGRTVKFFDGDNDGDLDLLNFAFPENGNTDESENYIYANNGSGQLVLHGLLPAVKQDGQKTLIFDVNNDRIQDLLVYRRLKMVSRIGCVWQYFPLACSWVIFVKPVFKTLHVPVADAAHHIDFVVIDCHSGSSSFSGYGYIVTKHKFVLFWIIN